MRRVASTYTRHGVLAFLILGAWLLLLNLLAPAPDRARSDDGTAYNASRVIGADDRELVDDTTVYPYRVVGQVRARWGDQAFSGTGTLIGPQTVLTAAHVVYRSDLGGWADQALFTPGRAGADEPYGTQVATDYRALRVYIANHEHADDVAIMTLGEAVGDEVGWMRVAASADGGAGQALRSAGYPADMPGHFMYAVSGAGVGLINGLLYTDLDAVFGQSGSPIWIIDADGDPTLVGVVVAELDNGTANLGVPVDEQLVADLSGAGDAVAASQGDTALLDADLSPSSNVTPPVGLCGVGVAPAMVMSALLLLVSAGRRRF